MKREATVEEIEEAAINCEKLRKRLAHSGEWPMSHSSLVLAAAALRAVKGQRVIMERCAGPSGWKCSEFWLTPEPTVIRGVEVGRKPECSRPHVELVERIRLEVEDE